MNNGIVAWARTSPARHGLAVASTVVALGGMVLLGGLRAEARPGSAPSRGRDLPSAARSVSFSGAGLRGSLTLGQSLAPVVFVPHCDRAVCPEMLGDLGPGSHMFAELRLQASAGEETRAPLSMVVAMDTSASMSGPKFEEARQAVMRLLMEMRDDDEIAIVPFHDDAYFMRPGGRLGSRVDMTASYGPDEVQTDAQGKPETVRASLLRQVSRLQPHGGKAIPQALSKAIQSLHCTSADRAQRVLLVSDGFDGGRASSTELARQAATSGLVVSALGIGPGFGKAYLDDVARAGGGNLGFIRGGDDLAVFLWKELHEGPMTRVQSAEVTLMLPFGMEFVQAIGAEARTEGSRVTLQVGSLLAGDERRVVIELASRLHDGERVEINARASWDLVGHGREQGTLGPIAVTGDSLYEHLKASVNPDILASVVSAVTSKRQLAAIEAYKRGEQGVAQQLIAQNLADLDAARAIVPAASALLAQRASFEATGQSFQKFMPGSDSGKAAARSAEADLSHLSRSKTF